MSALDELIEKCGPLEKLRQGTRKIPKGRRNNHLTSEGGGLRAVGADYGFLLESLILLNGLCCEPPLERDEVEKIARSLARYPAGTASRGPDRETREAIPELQRVLLEREWKGVGGKTARDVYAALVKLAGRHGRMIPSGVRVSVSVRALALEAGASKQATQNATSRLMQQYGLLRRDGRGERGTSGAFVLVVNEDMRANLGHSTTGKSVLPLRAPRLRWSGCYRIKAGDDSIVIPILRLGKSCGQAIDALEAAGGETTLEELAKACGARRLRDFVSRVLWKLLEAGLIEFHGDVESHRNVVRFSENWLESLEQERKSAGEIEAQERDRERFARERANYRDRLRVFELRGEGLPVGKIAERTGLEVAWVEGILRKPDRAPTREEMDARRRERESLGHEHDASEPSRAKDEAEDSKDGLNRLLRL